MKLAVVGSRNFNDYELLHSIFVQYFWQKVSIVISGGAKGADSLAARLCKENKHLTLIEHLPDWNKHGNAAGPIRNELIVQDCDMILVFWDGKSKGTQSTISIGKRLKKPTFVVYF